LENESRKRGKRSQKREIPLIKIIKGKLGFWAEKKSRASKKELH